jgi:hypothetical protein
MVKQCAEKFITKRLSGYAKRFLGTTLAFGDSEMLKRLHGPPVIDALVCIHNRIRMRTMHFHQQMKV